MKWTTKYIDRERFNAANKQPREGFDTALSPRALRFVREAYSVSRPSRRSREWCSDVFELWVRMCNNKLQKGRLTKAACVQAFETNNVSALIRFYNRQLDGDAGTDIAEALLISMLEAASSLQHPREHSDGKGRRRTAEDAAIAA